MTRSLDADINAELSANIAVFIEEGTNADTGWMLHTTNPVVIGTTGMTAEQVADLDGRARAQEHRDPHLAGNQRRAIQPEIGVRINREGKIRK